MSFQLALDFLREARWFLPASPACGGLSWPLAFLLCILAFSLGCCCGGLTAVLALSARLRKALLWLITGVATSALQAEHAASAEVVLAQYRGDSI